MISDRPLIALVFLAGLSLCFAEPADAHTPVLVGEPSQKDVILIEDPELSQAFYGEMRNFPHTFEIRAGAPFTLFTQVLAPDIEGAKDTIGAIIIKERPMGGRVEEIARLKGESPWPTDYEPWGGDTYRIGPSFEKVLDAGVYRIQVYTADNVEKYVLVVGTREEMTLGYFELIGRIAEVKAFFGKSKLMVIESPFVYVPVGILILLGALWYRRRTQRGG